MPPSDGPKRRSPSIIRVDENLREETETAADSQTDGKADAKVVGPNARGLKSAKPASAPGKAARANGGKTSSGGRRGAESRAAARENDSDPADAAERTSARAARARSREAGAEAAIETPVEDDAIVIPGILSVLPERGQVLFPNNVLPLVVNDESAVRLIDDAAVSGARSIVIVAVRESETIESVGQNPDETPGGPPAFSDLYTVGTAAVIRMMVKTSDGIRLLIQGIGRVRLGECVQTEPYLRAKVEPLHEPTEYSADDLKEIEALRRAVGTLFQKAVDLSPQLPDELQELPNARTSASVMADNIGFYYQGIPISEKQDLLETLDVRQRLNKLMRVLTREVDVLELGSRIHQSVHSEMHKSQREYYLREQLKAIQKELGEADERTAEIDELRAAIEEAGMPEDAHREAIRELDRLARMPPAAAEYTVSRTYIDWLVAIPWQKQTPDEIDIKAAKTILDEDHYGLPKIKDRILEYLSVRKFKADGGMRQPILCFVGPPGVGKTSLARSIARAMGRKFVRISLGGVRDEAEIRGHRRTYVGALPGQIIQGIRRAGSSNPVFNLDEVDKLGMDFRGDPSSALLEVLDPEQNSTFRDHYLDVPFDLSRVLFITTANMIDPTPPALRDRMEVIELAGYTEEEKVAIAQQYLIPKQMKEHGLLEEEHITWQESAVRETIRGYTREAGVRNLEREIAALCRKVTRQLAEGRTEPVEITPDVVHHLLGAPRFEYEEVARRSDRPGVAIGLAYTPVGGEILFVEATRMPGAHQLILTGQLGDVMKESATAALSYIRSQSEELGIPPELFAKSDIHVHVPAGAIPKDGPSAGVAMVVAIASLLTAQPVRRFMAMTGEITLSGHVLPIGGVKEKVLAARRAGVRSVILPERNRKDFLEDIPKEVQEEMEVIFVETIPQALEVALEPVQPERIGAVS
ncbi:MAG TPA: endopeptidase La [Armatimonadota bacterium]|nr:endopeptidase La [Armatimonadota bacterium]